jgi:hypothetical protein
MPRSSMKTPLLRMQLLLYYKQLVAKVGFSFRLNNHPVAHARLADPLTWLGDGLSAFLAQSSSMPMIPNTSSQSHMDIHGKFPSVGTL